MNGSTPTTKADTRERLIEAVITETFELGHVGVSVEQIVRRADVARGTFYAHFDGMVSALEAAHQSRFLCYVERLLETCRTLPSWPLKVKVGIGATLDMAAAFPADARFLTETSLGVWDMPGGVPDSRDRLARFLIGGREETAYGPQLPGLLESVLVAGIAATISAQLRAGEAQRLPALAPELTELVLTCYLGREEATVLARRPRSKPSGTTKRSGIEWGGKG